MLSLTHAHMTVILCHTHCYSLLNTFLILLTTSFFFINNAIVCAWKCKNVCASMIYELNRSHTNLTNLIKTITFQYKAVHYSVFMCNLGFSLLNYTHIHSTYLPACLTHSRLLRPQATSLDQRNVGVIPAPPPPKASEIPATPPRGSK